MGKYLLTAVVVSLSSIASAATTFTFSGPDTDLGQTSVFTANGISITASGFLSNGTPGDLFGKNNGGDETGLGLVADPSGQNEIYFGTDFIQLDLVNVLGALDNLQITMNSATAGETWRVYNTSSAGTLVGATDILDGSNELPHSISPSLRYLDIVATGPQSPAGNVLVYQLSGVPEPSSVAMMLVGLGLAGLRFVKSRRSK